MPRYSDMRKMRTKIYWQISIIEKNTELIEKRFENFEILKNLNIPVVLYIEMGNEKVANTIVNEVGNGCVAMQIQTLHNVSKEDFESGQTWVSLMERNLEVLRKALQ